jgi:MarR family transcriptional regulator, lower aerobic nicotinate degradation pathway regulator
MGSHIMNDTANKQTDLQLVLDAIRRVVQTLNTSSREIEKKLGISMAQLFVLQKLTEAEQLSINELAARTFTHQSSVSVVVQKLKDRKLVRSKPSSRDARKMEISLTSEGKHLLRKAPNAAQNLFITAFNELPAMKQKQLAQLLSEYTSSVLFGKTTPPMLFEKDT